MHRPAIVGGCGCSIAHVVVSGVRATATDKGQQRVGGFSVFLKVHRVGRYVLWQQHWDRPTLTKNRRRWCKWRSGSRGILCNWPWVYIWWSGALRT